MHMNISFLHHVPSYLLPTFIFECILYSIRCTYSVRVRALRTGSRPIISLYTVYCFLLICSVMYNSLKWQCHEIFVLFFFINQTHLDVFAQAITAWSRIFRQYHYSLFIRGPGVLDEWQQNCQKISWQCPFKMIFPVCAAWCSGWWRLRRSTWSSWRSSSPASSGPSRYTIPKEIHFPRYNMKCSGENLTLRGIFHVVTCVPLHFMLYCGNLDYF